MPEAGPPSDEQGEPSSDPFCVDGHQVPSLMVLGAQKCATTSLAFQLQSEYQLRFGAMYAFNETLRGDDVKEIHFFPGTRGTLKTWPGERPAWFGDVPPEFWKDENITLAQA